MHPDSDNAMAEAIKKAFMLVPLVVTGFDSSDAEGVLALQTVTGYIVAKRRACETTRT
jgi:hypothetical protein